MGGGWQGEAATLEHMVCGECGEVFDEDLFAEDHSETFMCPLCGTLALDAAPIEDRMLHIHYGMHVAARGVIAPEAPRLSA